MKTKVPILITPGEPSGIGPDIVIQSVNQFTYPYLIIADPKLLADRAKQLKIKFPIKNIIPVSSSSSRYVLDCLDIAIDLCERKKAAALLTGPVNKAMINRQKIKFLGHTHYLSQKCGVKDVVMYFESPGLKLALVTDHIPLSKVPQSITRKRLSSVITLLESFLSKTSSSQNQRIAVCGLNPHAGENGFLGKEEIEIISPVITFFQKKSVNIVGPFSADSLFYQKNLKKYDAIIAMYHDQGLSVLKHKYFGKSVNITLGLPFLRTSVDHGTACEIAGTGKANPSSLLYAFSRTVDLVEW